MANTRITSVGRRGFLKSAAAVVATAQSVPPNAVAQNSAAPPAAQDWIALTREAALEPQLPIIDPHHHFWDAADRMPRRYLLEDRKQPPTSGELLAANRDWYLYMIDHFGPGRCMFESNFPVDRLSCSYTVLWNQFKKLTQGFSAGERAAMFHDTAMRVYRLPKH